mmetsp:Transcript_23894/g.35834  ORF Transcript_23894/g.35834 Transcript_23894/m.35834 type:complete len:86 (-) Transcript_23894:131-388(-)
MDTKARRKWVEKYVLSEKIGPPRELNFDGEAAVRATAGFTREEMDLTITKAASYMLTHGKNVLSNDLFEKAAQEVVSSRRKRAQN